ncbi:DUF7342 family protein [Halococcoides cellulosivorans]|uniref:ArsR family transcriptional regulator n=1 Tax=Halococcoides cellulosivorans TaxID=1679096 RepID=A0A2R4X2A0_9EURY|nr:hypothetical protein [Halococcoides cellulosivorans]AWB27853.1 hypothetical protein HARCEL1_09075 [Halococcoides cellulosivorans]
MGDESEPTVEGPTPDAESLPERSIDDIDAFEVDPDEFDDLDEFATAEWTASTTARERVRAVAKRTTEPTTAGAIADRAAVSVTAARNTLNALVEDGPIRSEQTTNGRLYARDPDWHLMGQIERLSRADALVDRIQALQEELAEYRDTYGVDSPAEALVESDLSDSELDDMSHWRTARRDLAVLQAAYRFREARRSTRTGGHDARGVPQ